LRLHRRSPTSRWPETSRVCDLRRRVSFRLRRRRHPGKPSAGRGMDARRRGGGGTVERRARDARIVRHTHHERSTYCELRVRGQQMKLGVFTPVFGKLTLTEMLANVRSLQKLQAIEIGTGGWPGHDHLDLDALLADERRARE